MPVIDEDVKSFDEEYGPTNGSHSHSHNFGGKRAEESSAGERERGGHLVAAIAFRKERTRTLENAKGATLMDVHSQRRLAANIIEPFLPSAVGRSLFVKRR